MRTPSTNLGILRVRSRRRRFYETERTTGKKVTGSNAEVMRGPLW